jgi:hypothetical protein
MCFYYEILKKGKGRQYRDIQANLAILKIYGRYKKCS